MGKGREKRWRRRWEKEERRSKVVNGERKREDVQWMGKVREKRWRRRWKKEKRRGEGVE